MQPSQRITAATILLLITLSASPGMGRPALSPEHLKSLTDGKVLSFSDKVSGSRVMMGKAIGIINDAPEAVIYVLLGLDKYKHFLPRVTESRITKQQGWHTYAVVHTDLPWPVKDCWAYLKITRYDKPGRVYEMKWWMINGTMRNYTGSALVEPWNKDGTQSVVTYQLLFEPNTSAPDSMISDGVKNVASTIVKRVGLRLKALRKFNKMPKELSGSPSSSSAVPPQ